MKIQFLIPAQKVMQIEAVQSLIAMQSGIYNKGDNCNIAFTNGHNPVLARTSLLRYAAKQNDVDYVCCLDSDHLYRSKDLYTLIDKMKTNNLRSLSAAYLVRGPCRTLAHGVFVEGGKFKQLQIDDCKGITDCDVLGMGFWVFDYALVKEIVDKNKTNLFNMDYSRYSTEDVFFCEILKGMGERICFDADTVVGHLLTMVNK